MALSGVMAFDTWGYDDGQRYMGSWISLIILLAPSVVFNFCTFLLLSCSPQLSRSSSSLLVRLLCMEDAAYALCCLISCALNLHHMNIYGEHVGCEIQAAYMMFFQLCTGYTLCCMAYNSERKVAGKRGLSQRQVWLTHVVIWVAAALITVLSTVVVAPPRVYPSGTFCLVAINEIGPALLFWLPGLAVILVAITYRYTLLYRYISQRSTALADQYAKTPAAASAQMRQIAAAKRMAAIVASFLLSNLPFAILGLYELCSGQDAPAVVTVSAAWLIHLGSMLNPIIYVWLNGKIRAALSDAVRHLLFSTATVSPLHDGQPKGGFALSPMSDSSSTPTMGAKIVPSPSTTSSTVTSGAQTRTTLTVATQQPPFPSPSLTRTTLTIPPPSFTANGAPSPLQPFNNKRRASALTLVVDGGSTRPGRSAVAVLSTHSNDVPQPMSKVEPLCSLNTPSESPSGLGGGGG